MLLGLPVAGLLTVSSVAGPLPLPETEPTTAPSSAADLEAEALYNAGVERFEEGEFEAALVPLEASLELLDDPNTRYAYAQTLNKLGRCPEAVREYERILDAVPEGSDVQRVLEGAIRACAGQMAEALSEAEAEEEEAQEEEPAPPAVLRLPVPKPTAVGQDPGRSWRQGGVAAMAVGGVGIVIGVSVAAYFSVRGREFSNNLELALTRQDAAGCTVDASTLECEQFEADIDTWRANGDQANRLALVSGVVGVGLGVTSLVAGGLVFREGTLRTKHWRSGRPSAGFVPTPNGAVVVGRF